MIVKQLPMSYNLLACIQITNSLSGIIMQNKADLWPTCLSEVLGRPYDAKSTSCCRFIRSNLFSSLFNIGYRNPPVFIRHFNYFKKTRESARNLPNVPFKNTSGPYFINTKDFLRRVWFDQVLACQSIE